MANTGPTSRGTAADAAADAETRRLEDELAELRKELARVSSLVGDIASHRYEAAKDRAAGYADEAMRQGACRGTGQIEEEDPEMAERIFNIISEDPEEEHVAAQMKKVAMEKRIGEKCQFLGQPVRLGLEGVVVEKE